MKSLLMILVILFFAATANGATFDPSFSFKTSETEHFSIHYHQGLERMAGKTAVIAEEIHARLSPLLGWVPEEKTNLILADNSDFANGMATVLPWNAIYLQTVPPDIMSSIGEYDDWLRMLIVHEYAHILTSDPVRGYSGVMRRIFGKTLPAGDLTTLLLFLVTAPPNVMMPGWWHEGMATWSETELTSAGRGRSSFYDMIFRTAVAENNLPTIDLINGDVPYWPSGNLPYIFGSRLIQYLATGYDSNVPGKISIQQSGRPPYFINGTPEDQLGKDYPALYQEMLASLKKEQEEKIALLEKKPLTKLRRIGVEGYWDSSPRFSPDGALVAFNRDDRHNHRQIVILDRNGQVRHSLRRQYGDGTLSWSPDGRQLYFSQAELRKSTNLYQDIYRYDLDNDRLTRLTCGLRGGEPDVSPDGRTLAVIINERGSQNLALIDIDSVENGGCSAPPKLLTSYREFRVAAPRWSPDGKSIVYTVKDNAGNSSLNLIGKTGDNPKTLVSGHYAIATPAWSRNGSQIYYSSDETGVFNIFALNPEEGISRETTHLLSGGFSPDSSPDGALALTHYTSKGFTVAVLEPEAITSSAERSPSVRGDRYPTGRNTLKGETSPAAAPADQSAAPYSPWNTVVPRFWLPSIMLEGPEGTAHGVLTAGQDILGYHTLLASAWYGPEFSRGYYNILYEYGRHTPSLNLHAYALPVTYDDLLGYGDYTELENGLVASVSLPLLKLESGLSLVAGYHLRDQEALSRLTGGRFNGLKVFEGRRDSYFGGFDYSNALKYPWSVSHEEGRNLSSRVNYYGKASGSDLDYREYTLAWEEYLRLPQHHSLMVRLAGGMAEGDQPPQQAFQLGGLSSEFNPYGVRGYEPRFDTGSYVATATIEYRFPAWYFLRGINTKPLFFDRLHGAFFTDAGEIWDKDRSFRGSEIQLGVGTEVRMDMTLGYWLRITPAIGYARGLNRDGIDQIYFTIYANL